MRKRTKIVCTLGPASATKAAITAMVQAGMNVARLNFSHGTYENHETLINNIRAVEKETGEPIAILQDLQGPKIRLGALPADGIIVGPKETVVFDTALDTVQGGRIPVEYRSLGEVVAPGQRLLINDGRVEMKIQAVRGSEITAVTTVGGLLTAHQGINVPEATFIDSCLTEKDLADARFGVLHEVDMIALSFVTRAKEIIDLRYFIKEWEKENGKKEKFPIRIIAKIERAGALTRIEEVIAAADGIMVARGDLGIETPPQDVPLAQKRLVDAALAAAKPVIVATQMLDSMQKNPRPTRAEVSDVANAVIDHADALMLSNETAVGDYPVETVRMMSDIIAETEKSLYDDLELVVRPGRHRPIDDIMSQLARVLAEEVKAKVILAASLSGDTGRLISRHRPELPIVVGTSTRRVLRQLNLSWGVRPFLLEPCATIEELVERSLIYLKHQKIARSGDKIIVVAGEPVGHAGHVNLLEVRSVP